MYQKILVALDNSPADESLIPHVSALAAVHHSQLLLLHVADGFAARNFDQLKLAESEEMKADRAYLERLALELIAQGLQVTTHLALGEPPQECEAWTYNAHTPRKWRMAAWFGCKPDFSRVKQAFKNLSDKRIVAKLDSGIEGCSLYDWWNDEQVKNVSEEKTEHPCQIPEAVMSKAIRITPCAFVVDPFSGSGTTLRAAKDAGVRAIGIELNERYCEIAAKRLAQESFNFAGGDADFGVTDSNISSKAELWDSPNAEVSDRRAHGNDNTTGANGGSLH